MCNMFDIYNVSNDQRQIIEDINGPIRVISGPGSGKTRTMVLKYLYLIQQGSFEVSEIIFLTFTNKAANEISDRIVEYSDTLGIDIDFHKMNVSTIHAFCKSIIDDNSDIIDQRPCFEVLDEIGQATILLTLAEGYLYKSGVRASKEIVHSVVPYINKITDENLSSEEIYDFLKEKLRNISNMTNGEINAIKNAIHLNSLCPIYERTLQKNNYIDFAHMQKYAYHLICNNETLLNRLRSKYKYLLIDEFQDTSYLQNEILMKISEPSYNFTVCGDDDQAIYRFRGATVMNFLSLSDKIDGLKNYYLSTNYRASNNLVNLSNTSILGNEDYRLDKTIVPSTREDGLISIKQYSDAQEEIESTLDTIENCINDGIFSYNQIAILFRSINSYALELVKGLRDRRIPYSVKGIDKFESSAIIRSIVETLNYLVNRNNTTIQIGDNILFENEHNLTEHEPSATRISTINENDFRFSVHLMSIKDKIINNIYKSNLAIYYDILHNNEFIKNCIERGDYGVLQDIGYLSNVFNLFDSVYKRTDPYLLNVFLQNLIMKGIDDSTQDNTNSVQIMTIHQAKGLEFPCVIMPNQIRTTRRRNKFSLLDELFNYEESDSLVITDIDELKIFYVGITRAQRALFLSYAGKSLKGVNRRISPRLSPIKNMSGGRHRIMDNQIMEDRNSLILSFSQIMTYLDCPRKYYLMYIAKLSTVQQAEMYFGLSMHRALDEVHKKINEGISIRSTDMRKILRANWISIFRTQRADMELFNTGLRYLNNYYGSMVLFLSNKNISSEVSFKHYIQPSEVYLNGVIDLITENEDNTIDIIDFKISNIEHHMYNSQMKLYGYILENQEVGNISSLILYSLAEGSQRVVPYDENDISDIEQTIETVSNSIRNEVWDPTNNYSSCISCPYKTLCGRNSS